MPSVSNVTSPSQLGVTDKTSKSSDTKAKNDIDKDMFLKLMVTQLKYQDPLNPADPDEFLAQTAQFTSSRSSPSWPRTAPPPPSVSA